MPLDTQGERVTEELKDVLSRILTYYSGELAKAYEELCAYIARVSYDGESLDIGKIKNLLGKVAEKDGGYVGNTTIQNIFGINYRLELANQIDLLDFNKLTGDVTKNLDGEHIKVSTGVKKRVDALVN